MSRLARAIEILEVLNEYFQEGAEVLHADALLLEDDTRIKDAIADCIGEAENQIAPTIPNSRRKRIGKNFYGNWVGFIGKHKVEDFGGSGEEAALQWLWRV